MEENITIEEILDILKDGWRVVLISTLIGTLISSIFTFFLIEPKYETSTKVYVGKVINEETKYNNDDVFMYQKLMKTYVEVVKSKEVIKEAIAKSNLDLTVNEVINGITVTPIADTSMIEIKYKWIDPAEGLTLVMNIRESFISKAKTLVPNADFKILEEARYNTIAVSPNKKLNIAVGLVIGMLVGLGILFVMAFLDNTYKTKEALEKGLDVPVLGSIPKI